MNDNLSEAPKLIDSCGNFAQKRKSVNRTKSALRAKNNTILASKLLYEMILNKTNERKEKMKLLFNFLSK